MKNKLDISKLLQNKHLYTSVTILPNIQDGTFEAVFYTKEKTLKGKNRVKSNKYKSVINYDILPKISNETVKHLGYSEYYHLKEKGFYINLYFSH